MATNQVLRTVPLSFLCFLCLVLELVELGDMQRIEVRLIDVTGMYVFVASPSNQSPMTKFNN